jgi:hypothetical protein
MALNLPFLTKDVQTGPRKPIQEFVARVKSGGLARTNRYAVMFAPPSKIATSDMQKVLLFCDQIQLPGANFSTVQNRTFGEFREVPYEKLYDQINLSFYVDTEMKVKALFDDWQNLIANPVTRTYGYYKDYTTDMTIEVQDLNDKTRYVVRLVECYPKTVNSIQMDMNSKDVMKVTIGFQYKFWVASPIAPLANGEQIPTTWYDKLMSNFSGFQQTLNKTLGTTAGNFVTGAAGAWAVSKLPTLLKF